MNNKIETYETVLEHLKSKLPNVDNFINEITEQFAPFIIDYLRGLSDKELKPFRKILNFRLQLVIDNNILFAEIKGLIKGGKEVENCFFYQLALSRTADFYGPPFLREEILEKVEEKFEEKDRAKAKKFANTLLDTIKIKDAQWVDDWIKAKRKIAHRDPDDVPYLALCLDLKGHGIMSNDKIFIEEQNDVKVWNIHEAGSIKAQFHKGVISFFFVGNIPNVFTVISDLLKAVVVSIISFIKDTIQIILGILKEGLSYLLKMPSQWLLLFGGGFLLACLGIDGLKDSIHAKLVDLKQFVLKLVKQLKEWFTRFLNYIKKLFEIGRAHV